MMCFSWMGTRSRGDFRPNGFHAETHVGKHAIMQGEKVLAYFPVRCREPMSREKAFGSCAGASGFVRRQAKSVALCARAGEKGVGVLFGYGIIDVGNDRATPGLQVECRLRGTNTELS